MSNATSCVRRTVHEGLNIGVCWFQNALDLTAPASDALLKNRKNAWVQLAGHPGVCC